MQVRSPVWTLKELCAACGQCLCLVFVAYPGCGRLAIVCDEEGSVFVNPPDLASLPHDPATAACPGCNRHLVASLPPATDVSIRAAGFDVTEYE